MVDKRPISIYQIVIFDMIDELAPDNKAGASALEARSILFFISSFPPHRQEVSAIAHHEYNKHEQAGINNGTCPH